MNGQELDFEVLEESLRTAFEGRYAGLWVEDSGRSVPDAVHIAVAALRRDDEHAARLPMEQCAPGVNYFLHSVAYSEEELQGFLGPLLSIAAEGNVPEELTVVGIDVTRNAVVVSVSSPPRERLAGMLSDIPADALQLTTASYRPL